MTGEVKNVSIHGGAKAGTENPAVKAIQMPEGTVLLNRYVVGSVLQTGGFGKIFEMRDKVSKTNLAMKVQGHGGKQRLKLEMLVLMQLRGKKHFPKIAACGTYKDCPYIILQRLGKNLHDLRIEQPYKRFSDGTTFRIAEQLFSALREVHRIGFLHRDIKPSNCCIGVRNPACIYLIDFGMAREYMTQSGRVRKPRDKIAFRGTQRYSCLMAHKQQEQGPSGDLLSCIYTLVEIFTGKLPWDRFKQMDDIMKAKESTTMEKLCEAFPKPFLGLAQYCVELDYEDFPNYSIIFNKIDECIHLEFDDYDRNEPYDWEYLDALRAAGLDKPDMKRKGARTRRRTTVAKKSLRPTKTATALHNSSRPGSHRSGREKEKEGGMIIDPPTAKMPNSKHKLINRTGKRMVFRVTTSTEYIELRPFHGFVEPHAFTELAVGYTKKYNDKVVFPPNKKERFKVHYAPVPDNTDKSEKAKDVFKKLLRVELIKIPVILPPPGLIVVGHTETKTGVTTNTLTQPQ